MRADCAPPARAHRTRSGQAGTPRRIILFFGVIVITLSVSLAFQSSAGAKRQEQTDLRAADPTDAQDVQAFLDGALLQSMGERRIVGTAVAVIADGRLVLAKGYGFADLDRQTPVEADRTLFYIGSVGKLFTWTAVMQLVEQGRLDPHTDINTYLDFTVPPAFSTPTTMAHLMTHTAGFEEQFQALL
ncbi:MAG: serine hydrolase domain-containing protein, partial [Chloroflexota bacterium]